jgi:hypothetical protein
VLSNKSFRVGILGVMLILSGGLRVLAQSDQAGPGPVTLNYHQFEYRGGNLHVFGGVTMTSQNYNLTADSVTILLAAKQANVKSKPLFQKAVAESKPNTDQKVNMSLNIVSKGEFVKLSANRAVITPEPTRPGGFKLELTGGVNMLVTYNAGLAEPSPTTLSHLVVLLGKGPDYPVFQGDGPGQTILTPLQ